MVYNKSKGDFTMLNKQPKFHTHKDERGVLVKCYHESKSLLLSVSFWLGMTLGFPLEHFIWEKLPGFSWITHWLGL